MQVAIVTFDGFDEIDTFVALGLIHRLGSRGWRAQLCCPGRDATSMGGVTVQAQQPLEFANQADAVIFTGGLYARAIADDHGRKGALLDRLQLDPLRQLIAAQCSGTLLLARLGLLADMPACTDAVSKPWLVQAGVRVIDEPFHARGSIATAGGSLASQYLAAWVMVRGAGREAAEQALAHSAPVGRQDDYVARIREVLAPFIDEGA